MVRGPKNTNMKILRFLTIFLTFLLGRYMGFCLGPAPKVGHRFAILGDSGPIPAPNGPQWSRDQKKIRSKFWVFWTYFDPPEKIFAGPAGPLRGPPDPQIGAKMVQPGLKTCKKRSKYPPKPPKNFSKRVQTPCLAKVMAVSRFLGSRCGFLGILGLAGGSSPPGW